MKGEPLLGPADLRRLDRLALLVRRIHRGAAPGEFRTRRKGTGGEFADHRSYAPGDDPRYVDWAAYARHGDLVVKTFESLENVNLLLCVDRSASMVGAKAREARRLAAALGHVALRRRDALELAWLPPTPAAVTRHRGDLGRQRFFEVLRATPDGGPTRLAADLDAVLGAAGRAGPAVLLSDFFDPAGAVGGLRRLMAHGYETTALHLLDPADAALPEGEAVRAFDRETGATFDLDVTPEVGEAVRTAWRRRADRLRSWCFGRGIGYVRAEVGGEGGRSFWDVLRDMLRVGTAIRR
jgi:uncharacterized protein (DUF58 family)